MHKKILIVNVHCPLLIALLSLALFIVQSQGAVNILAPDLGRQNINTPLSQSQNKKRHKTKKAKLSSEAIAKIALGVFLGLGLGYIVVSNSGGSRSRHHGPIHDNSSSKKNDPLSKNDSGTTDTYVKGFRIKDLKIPQDKNRLLILLSTGSFNPIHTGHILLPLTVRRDLGALGYKNIQCIIGPSHGQYVFSKYKNNSDKQEEWYIDYEKRKELIRKIVDSLCKHQRITQEEKDNIEVGNIEDGGFIEYYDVYEKIEKQHPEATIIFCAGQDLPHQRKITHMVKMKRGKGNPMSSSKLFNANLNAHQQLKADAPEYYEALMRLKQFEEVKKQLTKQGMKFE